MGIPQAIGGSLGMEAGLADLEGWWQNQCPAHVYFGKPSFRARMSHRWNSVKNALKELWWVFGTVVAVLVCRQAKLGSEFWTHFTEGLLWLLEHGFFPHHQDDS